MQYEIHFNYVCGYTYYIVIITQSKALREYFDPYCLRRIQICLSKHSSLKQCYDYGSYKYKKFALETFLKFWVYFTNNFIPKINFRHCRQFFKFNIYYLIGFSVLLY